MCVHYLYVYVVNADHLVLYNQLVCIHIFDFAHCYILSGIKVSILL